MIEICDTCIKISLIDLRYSYYSGLKRPEYIKQCPDCNFFWQQKRIQTIRFYWYKRIEQWKRSNIWWGETIYSPMECTQRRCLVQARHKVKTKGKRKYKCDKHAGVCIIA